MRHRILVLFALLSSAAFAFAGGGQEQPDTQPDSPPTAIVPAGDNDSAPTGASEEAPETPSSSPAESTPIRVDSASRYVARVNGVGILVDDFEDAVLRIQQQYASAGQVIPDSQMGELRSQVLDQLIAQELLLQEASNEGVTISTQQIDAQYQSIRGQVPTDEQWQQVLDANGTTDDGLRDQIRRSAILQQMVANALEGIEPVTQEEIESFYTQNPSYFMTGETVTARHILISTDGLTTDEEIADARERAEAIRQQLLDGADFAMLAIQESEGPSAAQGGELGTFGRGQMVAPFEEAAFALEVGEISEVVQTQFGFHVIQVTDRSDGGMIPLEDVSSQIEQVLNQQNQEEALNTYVDGLKTDASIEVLRDVRAD